MMASLLAYFPSFSPIHESFEQPAPQEVDRSITIAISKPSYAIGKPITIIVADVGADLDGLKRDTVEVTLTTFPSQQKDSVTLVEEAAKSGIFTNNVTLFDESCISGECAGMIVKKGDIVRATYRVELTGIDAIRECGDSPMPKCMREYSTTTIIEPVETIIGRPYLVTLKNSDKDGMTATGLLYKVTFQFKTNNYSLLDVERGDFDNAYANGKNVIVFAASSLEAGQNKSGLVTFNFGRNATEDEMKANITVNLITNSKQASGSVDPGGVLDVISEILKIGDAATDLAIKIYQNTVSCFSLDPTTFDMAKPNSIAVYDIRISNCSQHPQAINLKGYMVSGVGSNNVEFHFNPSSGDTPANSDKSVKLDVVIPSALDPGTYYFHVDGYVILDILGYKRNVTSSGGDAEFTIIQGVITPEFPARSVAMLGVTIASMILTIRYLSGWRLTIQ